MVVNRNLKPTFGTGIHTVTPAHNLNDLKISYEYNLPRVGCVDATDGKITKPSMLIGEDIGGTELLPRMRFLLEKED